uniref:Transmembrane protein 144a n=1 Tax=Callorhinchus milii TaxID=7868 RepID=A0A4W3HE32_CALMI
VRPHLAVVLSTKATGKSTTGTFQLLKGFISLAVAVIGFGSNFVPVKKIDTGDGLFFQWIFCTAIWVVSLVVHLIQNCPKFWPLTMLGGFLWATGNITVIPILKTIGLGMGVLIWATFSLLMGWASSRFGWFGLNVQEVPSPILNYIGTAMAKQFKSTYCAVYFFCLSNICLICCLVLFLRGSSLAMCSGLLYGSSFAPVLYIKNHAFKNDDKYFGASQFDIDYVFAYCSGIILTSTVYFLIYCGVKKNKPSVYSTAILPAFFSGLLWGIANSAWFLANYYLSAVITFPLVTAVSIKKMLIFVTALVVNLTSQNIL